MSSDELFSEDELPIRNTYPTYAEALADCARSGSLKGKYVIQTSDSSDADNENDDAEGKYCASKEPGDCAPMGRVLTKNKTTLTTSTPPLSNSKHLTGRFTPQTESDHQDFLKYTITLATSGPSRTALHLNELQHFGFPYLKFA